MGVGLSIGTSVQVGVGHAQALAGPASGHERDDAQHMAVVGVVERPEVVVGQPHAHTMRTPGDTARFASSRIEGTFPGHAPDPVSRWRSGRWRRHRCRWVSRRTTWRVMRPPCGARRPSRSACRAVRVVRSPVVGGLDALGGLGRFGGVAAGWVGEGELFGGGVVGLAGLGWEQVGDGGHEPPGVGAR